MSKILIVDDDREIASLIGDSLYDEGYETLLAYDGEIALEKVSNNLDLEMIILDIMMPKVDGLEHISKKKITQAMLFGCGIGWICGFTGSGGGILMLTVFTLHLGYNLKVAVGTSTMIMTLVALTGTVSHISMGATVEILPTLLVVICCVIGAYVSAKFANKCEIKKLNKVVGTCLGILGVITILLKLI